MDGLSEKITEILEEHADSIRRYKEQQDETLKKIAFYTEHNFQEEKRIASLKLNETSLLLYDYKNLYEKLQKAVDNWNS